MRRQAAHQILGKPQIFPAPMMNTKPPNLVLVNQAHKLQTNRFHKFIHSNHAHAPCSLSNHHRIHIESLNKNTRVRVAWRSHPCRQAVHLKT